jgi:hypothetical protein
MREGRNDELRRKLRWVAVEEAIGKEGRDNGRQEEERW